MEDQLVLWGVFAFAVSVFYRRFGIAPKNTSEIQDDAVTVSHPLIAARTEIKPDAPTRSVTIPSLVSLPQSNTVSDPLPAAHATTHGDDASFEILLHNVSHSDVVLQIANPTQPSEIIFARPKFSCFKGITETIHKTLNNIPRSPLHTVYQPVYGRQTDFRHCIKSSTEGYELPVGFDMRTQRVTVDKHKLKYRTGEKEKLSGDVCQLQVVYFPLLAILVEKWLLKVDPHNDSSIHKVIFLVSGEGVPRDNTARVEDNSTAITAMLMKSFIEKEYSNITVQLVHSSTNIFRYDENIKFVKRDLLPKIEGYRNYLAYEKGGNWREKLRLTMSFADGSSARISAINAALRPYRPSYMHFWQLKTFWYESKLCSDDIEHHSYEEISTIPAVQISHTTKDVRRIIDEMLRFKADFERLSSADNDLSSFWLRKTRKPVLAVLLVQRHPDEEPKLYRGTNMEVSMPTGSLCAERNVIGSALADDLTLKRHHIKYVAVLSMSLGGSGSSRSGSQVIRSGTECEVAVDFPSPVNTSFLQRKRTISTGEFPSPTEARGEAASHALAALMDGCSDSEPPSTPHRRTSSDMGLGSPSAVGTPKAGRYRNLMALDLNSSVPSTTNKFVPPPLFNTGNDSGVSVLNAEDEPDDDDAGLDMSDTWRPVDGEAAANGMRDDDTRLFPANGRKVVQQPPRTYEEFSANLSNGNGSCLHNKRPARRTAHQCIPPPTTIIVDESDMNPLKPCGACHEWLKKIAEFNPCFSVVTFTDVNCNGVYIEQIEG